MPSVFLSGITKDSGDRHRFPLAARLLPPGKRGSIVAGGISTPKESPLVGPRQQGLVELSERFLGP